MRALTKSEIAALLAKRFEEGFVPLAQIPSPFDFKDMAKAAKRIAKAVKNGEKIAIVGDYDVDGVVSSALMAEFFEMIDYPVSIKIPNRFEHGYGLSPKILDEIEADLVITVDNGITAFEAADICHQRGIDLIITDHHTPTSTLPKAFAIVNPKQAECGFDYEDICGAQVAWFLIGALKKELGLNLDMKRFLDLLAIAIVADVMPLKHINRSLLQAGLQAFGKSKRPAVRFLRDKLAKEDLGADDFGFFVAPLLNSAGRMEDASIALDFLRAKDSFEASIFYARLLALNMQRKEQERQAFEEALAFVNEESAIVAVGEDWNEGVIGIVASRLVDRFKKPAIVLTKSDKGYYKGSGRSLGEVNLFELLNKSSEYLLGFGGHKKAAGLMIQKDKIVPFRTHLSKLAAALPQDYFIEDDHILGLLDFDQIDWELIDILDRFAPYGESNPLPYFLAKDVEVIQAREVGQKGEHLLLTLRQRGRTFRAVKFRYEGEVPQGKVDIVFHPAKNIFNNQISLQLFIKNII